MLSKIRIFALVVLPTALLSVLVILSGSDANWRLAARLQGKDFGADVLIEKVEPIHLR